MLANNVQESTTTTGTGNITLAGASENGRTFTSQYATNERFTYFIDDGAGNFETGMGYLSGATTLVRELPQDGSASLPVNFGSGTKQVFVGGSKVNLLSNTDGFSNLGSNSIKFMEPSNSVQWNTLTLNADRIYYCAIWISRGITIDLLGVKISTASGAPTDNLHIGIYDVDANGEPGALLASAAGLDPSSGGLISGSITEMHLSPGWYYAGFWSNVTPTLRAGGSTVKTPSPFTSRSTGSAQYPACLIIDGQTSLSDLPATGNANDSVFNANEPKIYLGHT